MGWCPDHDGPTAECLACELRWWRELAHALDLEWHRQEGSGPYAEQADPRLVWPPTAEAVQRWRDCGTWTL